MGQTPSSPEEEPQQYPNDNRVMRPSSRTRPQRHDPIRSSSRTIRRERVPTMAYVPLNANQERDERRRRRELIREGLINPRPSTETEEEEEEYIQEQANEEVAAALAALSTSDSQQVIRETTNQNTTATLTTTQGATITPFARMIAQVICEAVSASFRGTSDGPQHLNMHISPALFSQVEPASAEDMFMRFLRLPVWVRSVSTPTPSNAVNADGETPTITQEGTEITRLMMLPIFLYGQRGGGDLPTEDVNNNENRRGTRSSARLRERRQVREEQQQQQQERRPGGGQWTVYIISGNSVENVMTDNPSYEELLNLATLIGPARRPTVSQEAIDDYLPLVKYTQQVKQTIVGNSEKCQVCLNAFQSEEDVRILLCHHGFHKDCIDEWLTQGQNKCPLCRTQVIPTTTD